MGAKKLDDEFLSEPLVDDSNEIEVHRKVEDDRDDPGVDFSTDEYDAELDAADMPARRLSMKPMIMNAS